MPRNRFALAAFAVLSAVLYSALLPLWEGFDEPFHFGYVQHIANGRGLPDPRTMHLSKEVAASLPLAPASEAVQRNLTEVPTYFEYFSWPSEKRLAAREQLHHIPTAARWSDSEYLPNYEGQHPPLAYALLALPERALASVPLPARVLVLRFLAAIGGTLLLFTGMRRLTADLGLPDPYGIAAAFCAFSCQMTWAAIAHVANDWLALPLAIWALSALIRFQGAPTRRTGVRLAVLLAAGLLAKAYFLALLPIPLAVCFQTRKWKLCGLVVALVLLLAGPWYARNVVLYGALSGMQESRSGIGLAAILKTASQLDWPAIVVRNARWALWTGNNTFRSFSTPTLNAALLLLLGAILMWAVRRHHKPAEWLTAAHCLVFSAALAYSTVLNFLYTHGAAGGPTPWCSQVLLPPLFALAFLGCSRAGAAGRALASILVVLFAYILVVSYFGRLIPLYAGFTGRGSLAVLTSCCERWIGGLDEVLLWPARLVVGLAFATSGLAVIQAAITVRSLLWTSDNPTAGAAR